jgi:hypothetical protein
MTDIPSTYEDKSTFNLLFNDEFFQTDVIEESDDDDDKHEEDLPDVQSGFQYNKLKAHMNYSQEEIFIQRKIAFYTKIFAYLKYKNSVPLLPNETAVFNPHEEHIHSGRIRSDFDIQFCRRIIEDAPTYGLSTKDSSLSKLYRIISLWDNFIHSFDFCNTTFKQGLFYVLPSVLGGTTCLDELTRTYKDIIQSGIFSRMYTGDQIDALANTENVNSGDIIDPTTDDGAIDYFNSEISRFTCETLRRVEDYLFIKKYEHDQIVSRQREAVAEEQLQKEERAKKRAENLEKGLKRDPFYKYFQSYTRDQEQAYGNDSDDEQNEGRKRRSHKKDLNKRRSHKKQSRT